MRFVVLLAALLAAAVAPPPARGADADASPPATVEEARARHQLLRQRAGEVDRWVEEHWEEEFPQWYPALDRGPRRAREPEKAWREREMRTRFAVAELKERLRAERRESIEHERAALFALEIRQPLPARLGPYDVERGVYPLLLGFGWPAGLAVTLKVPERDKDAFAARFPQTLPAVFRINDKEEVYLMSLGKAPGAEASVFAARSSPRLLWRSAHESWVTAVSVRPDGDQVVSGGGDGALCAWDAETGSPLWRLAGVEMAMSLAHAPGGALLATGGSDGMVRMRDGGTGKLLWRAGASGMVFSVAFSPDGRFLVSGDDGGSVRVWNTATGNEVARADLGAPVLSVDYEPDGRSIAAGCEAGFVVLLDGAAGRQRWKVSFDGPVMAVAAGPNGLVAAGGGGREIRVLRAADGTEAWRRKAEGDVRTARFDPGGRLLAYGGSGYSARVLLAGTGEPLWAASIDSPVRSLAFGPEGKQLVVGSSDFAVRLFAVDEGDRVQAAFTAFGPVYVDRERATGLFR